MTLRTGALATLLVLGLGVSGARADVAPDPPESWGARVVSFGLHDGHLRLVFEVRNGGTGPVSLRVQPDSSIDGRALTSTAASAGGARLAITSMQAGPREVRVTDAFTTPAGATVRVEIDYAEDFEVTGPTRTGVTVYETGAWRGLSLGFSQRSWAGGSGGASGAARRILDDVAAVPPSSDGCGCRVGGASPGAGLASLMALGLVAWRRRRSRAIQPRRLRLRRRGCNGVRLR